MAKGVKKTDVFESGDRFFDNIIGGARDLDKEIDKIIANIARALEASRSFLSAWKADGAKSINELTTEINKSNDAIKASNDLAIQQQVLRKATAEATQQEIKLKNQLVNEEKKIQKEITKNNSLYKQQSATLREMKNSYKDLVLAGKENEKETKALRASIIKLDGDLKHLDGTVGDHFRKVGQYENALKKAGHQLKHLGAIALAGFSLHGILHFTESLFEMQDEMEAVDRKARALFGESFEELEAQAEQVANAMGLTNDEYIKTITNLTQVQQNLGFTTEEAKRQATQLLKTANTLSMFDTEGKSAAEVADELGKALSGQTKILRQYGIVVDKNLDIEEAQAQGLESSKTAASQKAKALQILGQVTTQTNRLNVGSIKELTDAELKERQEEVKLRQAKEDLAMASEGLKNVWTAVQGALGSLILTVIDGEAKFRKLEAATGAIKTAYDDVKASWDNGKVSALEFVAQLSRLSFVQEKAKVFTGEFKKEFEGLAQAVTEGKKTILEAAIAYDELVKRQFAFNAEEEKKNADKIAADIAKANAETAANESEEERRKREAATEKAYQDELKSLEKQKTQREIYIEEEVQGEFEMNAAKLVSDKKYLEDKKALEEKYSKDTTEIELQQAKNSNQLTELLNKESLNNSRKNREDIAKKEKEDKDARQKEIDEAYEEQQRQAERTAEREEKERDDALKREEERFEQRKKFYESLAQAFEETFARENELVNEQIDKEIAAREEAIDRQLDLGEKASVDQLAFEKEQLAKAQLAREEQRKKELRQAKALAIAKAYIANLEQNQNSSQALSNAIRDSVLLEAVTLFAATGAENIPGPGTETSDSIIAALSKGESVVTAAATKRRPGLATAWNRGEEEEYIRQHMSDYMVKPNMSEIMDGGLTLTDVVNTLEKVAEKVEKLEKTTRGKKEWHIDLTKTGDVIFAEVENGFTDIFRYKNPRGRG